MLSPYHVQLLKALLQLLTAVRSCVLIFFSGCVSQFGIVIIKSATKREQRYTLDGSDPPSKRDMADLKQRHSIVVLKHGNVCTHSFPRACDGRITACGISRLYGMKVGTLNIPPILQRYQKLL